MRHVITATLIGGAIALTAVPAAADPACDRTTARTLHAVEQAAGPAGPAVHTVEGAACAARLP